MEDILKLKKNLNYPTIRQKIRFSYKKYPKKFLYYFKVWEETEVNILNHKDLAKRSPEFNLDHIIPISIGFQYNMDFKIIGHKNNLRSISRSENFKKNFLMTELVITKLKEFSIDFDKLVKINRLTHYKKKVIEISTAEKVNFIEKIDDNKEDAIIPSIEICQCIDNESVTYYGKLISDYPDGGDW